MDKGHGTGPGHRRQRQVAVRQSKAAIRRGQQTDMYTGAAYEAEAFAVCFATEDQKDAMTAFVNKEKVASLKTAEFKAPRRCPSGLGLFVPIRPTVCG